MPRTFERVTVDEPAVTLADAAVRLMVSVPDTVRSEPPPKPQRPAVQGTPAPQTVPHAPQLEVLLVRLTSQPSATVPLQSPKPVLHDATRHAPDAHAGTPLGIEHAVPQPPQFETSAPVLISHPSVAVRLQSVYPALQLKPQVPAAHVAVALARVGHTVVQAPQCVGSVLRFEQLPEQLVRPEAQVTTHAPAEHTCPEEHAVVQVPQWALSTCRSRQVPEQLVCVEGHTSVQTPATHDCPVAHARPQTPQLLTSEVRSRHEVPHAVRPDAQLVTHVEPEQIWPAGHTVEHVPQWLRSLVRSKHDAPHTDCPDGHDTVHTPAVQTCPEGHVVPHAPQLERSLLRSRHTPVQLVSPVAQVTEHVPATHAWPAVQVRAHAPQLLLSLVRSRHTPEQLV